MNRRSVSARAIPAAVALVVMLQFPAQHAAGQGKQELGSKDDARKICEVFLESLMKKDAKAALQKIRPYVSIPEKDFIEVVNEVGKQREEMSKRFGASISFEFLQEQSVKETLLKYTYMEKYQIHVIRWSFIFYKPRDKWILNSFYWDENIKDFFK